MSAAYDAFVDWYGQDVGGPTSYTFKEAFEAGYRLALEDAADDIDLSEFYDTDPRGRVSQECGHAETAAHRWLTARAAAAPDPRETKD